MTGRGKTTIRLAAVQARSAAGQIEANLKHAERLVEQAAGQGATMVVLPELLSCGYVPNRGVWDAAEAQDGRRLAFVIMDMRITSLLPFCPCYGSVPSAGLPGPSQVAHFRYAAPS